MEAFLLIELPRNGYRIGQGLHLHLLPNILFRIRCLDVDLIFCRLTSPEIICYMQDLFVRIHINYSHFSCTTLKLLKAHILTFPSVLGMDVSLYCSDLGWSFNSCAFKLNLEREIHCHSQNYEQSERAHKESHIRNTQ